MEISNRLILAFLFINTLLIITLYIWLVSIQSGSSPLSQLSVNGSLTAEGEVYVLGNIVNSEFQEMQEQISELIER